MKKNFWNKSVFRNHGEDKSNIPTSEPAHNRFLRKPGHEARMPGAYEAQSRSVHEVRKDSRIGATKQLPSGVEFRNRSNVDYRLWYGIGASCIMHLLIFLFGTSNLFNYSYETQEQVMTVEMVPVSEISNIRTQTKAVDAKEKEEDDLSDAKKTSGADMKQEAQTPQPQPQPQPQDKTQVLEKEDAKTSTEDALKMLDKEMEKMALDEKRQESKTEAAKEKKEEKKEEQKDKDKKEEVKTPAETKNKKKDKDVDLDSLLKNLEKASKGDNEKGKKKVENKSGQDVSDAFGQYDANKGLSISEKAWIKQKIEKAWNLPINAQGVEKVQIVLRVILDISGDLVEVKIKERRCNGTSQGVCQMVADSAMRAVATAAPFENLDERRYNLWREFVFLFDPGAILK
ncbi:Periplasmic protein TonB [Rickettsiales endosymbiont of Paramecium tredecaurelia]|uniref:energy transducer TonB n=1 Tax=Candidatus Sarmatiella mevalonica TaxID=2770581 RepID=UPI001924C1BD|nr:energy transducer TonB [Candidatus Sarmatiella mevalonica]MBL3284815.1 Periplasmic protein TonB [Candidatus Sarmatiella mevalonica]